MSTRRLKVSSAFVAVIAVCFLAMAPSASAAPANDNFVDAQTIGPAVPISVPASNIGATAEVGEPAIGGNAATSTVWFKWTAPATAMMVVDLCGAGFTGSTYPFQAMAVRTGATVGTTVLKAERTGECNLRFDATIGIQYKIQVDYRNDQGNFTFRLRNLVPPANDNFATSTVIGPALPVGLNTTNIDSTWEAGEPAILGGSGSSRSVWYTWTPAATGRARIDICDSTQYSSAQNKSIGVYTGNTLGTLVPITTATTNCQIDFSTTAGVPHRIAVSGSVLGEFNFVLRLKNAPPPANDNFANATVVGPALPVTLNGENEFATAETGEPEHNDFGAAQHSAWYKWTPTQSARVRIKTCGRKFEARVGVYTGAAVNALTAVGERPSYGPYCSMILNAVAGTTYSIAAAGGPQDDTSGAFKLDIHVLNVPANDDLADAQTLSAALPASLTGSTIDASKEDSEQSHALDYGSDQSPSVWFRWTSPTDEAIILSACSTTEPNRLAVYSGTGYTDLRKLASADEGCPAGTFGGRLAVAPVRGQTYLIAVATVNRDFESDFTLSSKGPTIAPPVIINPKPTKKFSLKQTIKKCKKIKSKKKRRACVKRARKKAAIIKCKKLKNTGKRNKCIKKARKKFR
ncbi:MAG: hypothetical protein IPK93_04860 [Solirubrobacterales bacterium]|nr:hypothetical protein [Solirubrobacterales bacterium]